MPRGDGTGPTGQGPGTGRGMGGGGRRGGGRGRMGGFSAGVGGTCVCPSCGNIVIHDRAVPCNQVKCPECGASMIRKT